MCPLYNSSHWHLPFLQLPWRLHSSPLSFAGQDSVSHAGPAHCCPSNMAFKDDRTAAFTGNLLHLQECVPFVLLTHVPRPLQSLGHQYCLCSHASPDHMSSHLQVPSTHLPLPWHAYGHAGFSQLIPIQSGLHKHSPFLSHTPRPVQFLLHVFASQDAPVHIWPGKAGFFTASHSHSPVATWHLPFST